MTEDEEQQEAEALILEMEVLTRLAVMDVSERARFLAELTRRFLTHSYNGGTWRGTADTWEEWVARIASYTPDLADGVILLGRQIAAKAN